MHNAAILVYFQFLAIIYASNSCNFYDWSKLKEDRSYSLTEKIIPFVKDMLRSEDALYEGSIEEPLVNKLIGKEMKIKYQASALQVGGLEDMNIRVGGGKTATELVFEIENEELIPLALKNEISVQDGSRSSRRLRTHDIIEDLGGLHQLQRDFQQVTGVKKWTALEKGHWKHGIRADVEALRVVITVDAPAYECHEFTAEVCQLTRHPRDFVTGILQEGFPASLMQRVKKLVVSEVVVEELRICNVKVDSRTFHEENDGMPTYMKYAVEKARVMLHNEDSLLHQRLVKFVEVSLKHGMQAVLDNKFGNIVGTFHACQ